MGIFIIYGLLVLMIIIGIIVIRKDKYNMYGFTLNLVAGIGIIFLTLAWILNYSIEKANIQEYYAIKSIIEQSRKSNISDIERAALTNKIIEVNQHLASVKYWNNTIWDYLNPDEEAGLEYLK